MESPDYASFDLGRGSERRSERVDAVARGGIGPAIDPAAVGALVPEVVGAALHARVVRHLAAERVRVAARAAAARGAAAVRAQRLLGVLDPPRLVALAAALEAILKDDGGVAQAAARAQRRQPVAAERLELVPGEGELRVERPARLAVRARVPRDVVVVVAIPAAAHRPLRDAAPRPAAELNRAGIDARLLDQVADDAGGLKLGQPFTDEEVERGVLAAGERRFRHADVVLGDASGGGEGEGENEQGWFAHAGP